MKATIGQPVFEPGYGVYRDGYRVGLYLPGTGHREVYGDSPEEAEEVAGGIAAMWEAAHP